MLKSNTWKNVEAQVDKVVAQLEEDLPLFKYSSIFCSPSSFTTYQISLPFTLTEEQQKEVVEIYNRILNTHRDKYHSMFLGFYIDAKQRIMNRTFVNKLLSKVISEVLKIK